MRPCNSETQKKREARVIQGVRRKLCNRQALNDFGLTDEVLSKLNLRPIVPGSKEFWYDVDEVIDQMDAAGRPKQSGRKTK